MDNEPELYVVPSRSKKAHIVGNSINSSMCGVGVGKFSKMDLPRLDVDYLLESKTLCKRCKKASTQMYLNWVNSLSEDDLEFTEGQ